MGYGKYLAGRVANMILVLVIVTFISSIIFNTYEDQLAKVQVMNQLRAWEETHHKGFTNTTKFYEAMQQEKHLLMEEYGLLMPYWEKVIYRTYRVLTLHFGTAQYVNYLGTRNVKLMTILAMRNSMALFTTATIINMFIGILLGTYIATRAGSLTDRTVSIIAMIGWSMPTWWLGMMMLYLLAYKLGIAPPGRMFTPSLISQHPPWYVLAVDFLRHLWAPVLTLVIVAFGGWAWTMRNILINIFQEDYIMAARAKGTPERRVLYGHALRSAAPPLITMILTSLIGSLWGGILTEIIWNWPGMGRLYWVAIGTHDVAVLLGLTYISVIMVVTIYLVMDILYGVFDPRVRVGGQGSSR